MERMEKIVKDTSFKREWFTRANDASYDAYVLSFRYGGEFCRLIRDKIQTLKDDYRIYSGAAIENNRALQEEMEQRFAPLEAQVRDARARLEDESNKRRASWLLHARKSR